MGHRFSVIVPLYNKRGEIAATIGSILAQTHPPHEIVVVDDGSTDGSGDIVRGFDSPLIKLITQPNAGECAARNRAMAEAAGDHYALLDADDCWKPGYLAEIARLIDLYPGCGLYATGFDIVSKQGVFPGHTPGREGIVDNFFRASLSSYVSIPSASTIPAAVVADVGGFPEGMKMGGDQFMWVKIALKYKFCVSPARMTDYSVVASNRSSSIYVPEKTAFSFRDFYSSGRDPWLDEYLARVELGKALTLSAKGQTAQAAETARFYSYTRYSRRTLLKLRILNVLPRRMRPRALAAYNALAWRIAKKGL